jgi:hypothetical protein
MTRENLLKSGVAYIDFALFENKLGQINCMRYKTRDITVFDVLDTYEALGLTGLRYPNRGLAPSITKLIIDKMMEDFTIEY